MNENKNILSPERQIMILGPRLDPLSERMGRDRFDGEAIVEERQNVHIAGPSHELDEKSLLDDYFDFLADVKQAAEDDTSDEAVTMHDMAERFARETTYLSVADARAAVRGIGASQADYLLADTDRQLFLYVPGRSRDKSQGKFAEDMDSYISTAFEEVASRVHIIGTDMDSDKAILDTADPKHAKIVLLDDWSVTGNQISNEVAHAEQYLETARQARFRNNLEVNLLVIRTDQVSDSFHNLHDVEETYRLQHPIPLRTFYTSKSARQHAGPMPTGAHSAVDYGFSSQIGEMRDYLAVQTHDHDRPLPYLATAKRLE